MTVLAQNQSRGVLAPTLQALLPLKASADPFLGSGIIRASDGYVREAAAADAGLPFEGFASKQVETRFAPTVDGGPSVVGGAGVEVDRGIFLAEVPLTGVAADDVFHRRAVFLSDDATFSMTASAGSYVGNVIGIARTDVAMVVCFSHAFKPLAEIGVGGTKTMAATGAQSVTTGDLGKLILLPNSAAFALTLPLAADCAGRGFIFKKTTAAAFAVTLTGAGAETIDGANTNATIAAQWNKLNIISDGVAWFVV